MIAPPPPHVRDALGPEPPDFVVQGTHPITRRYAIVLGLFSALVALVSLWMTVRFARGDATFRISGGGGTHVLGGTGLVLATVAFALVAFGFAGLIARLALRGRRIPGPWFAGTEKGLLIVGNGRPALLPWASFVDARIWGSDVVLRRPHTRSGRPRPTILVEVPDPRAIHETCSRRIREARGKRRLWRLS